MSDSAKQANHRLGDGDSFEFKKMTPGQVDRAKAQFERECAARVAKAQEAEAAALRKAHDKAR